MTEFVKSTSVTTSEAGTFGGVDTRAMYLDLMKKVVANFIYGDPTTNPGGFRPYDPEMRRIGKGWPRDAHTMIGMKRLDNIQDCVETVIQERIPGDFIETGVWRGGACIFMRALLKAYGDCDRKVWLADSFQGLPRPDANKYPADSGDKLYKEAELAVSLEQVQSNFRLYGLLDKQVEFLPGWFRDTLPAAPIEKLAILRLDGDMYESTIVALESLYPKLSPGGYCIIDDYSILEGCRKAIHDYRERFAITEPLETIDFSAVFWRKRK
ncbi:MAG TPA: macrocin O-methyltransferase [Candidatus Melainabacteria bacterium]|nr:macrocin O-methyltransferase [Candidatus Melainabacteria bacterium]HIN64913.1 macrocin O-methyltransferase [Candidatus Obscuribacterales bacterium]